MNNIEGQLSLFLSDLFQKGVWDQSQFYKISNDLKILHGRHELASGILSQQLIGGASLCLSSHLDDQDDYKIRNETFVFDTQLKECVNGLNMNVPAHLRRESVIGIDDYTPAANSLHKYQDEYKAAHKTTSDDTGLLYYGYRYYQPWVSKWMKADPSAMETLHALQGSAEISSGLKNKYKKDVLPSHKLHFAGVDTGRRNLQQVVYKAQGNTSVGNGVLTSGDYYYLNAQYQDRIEVFDERYNRKDSIIIEN